MILLAQATQPWVSENTSLVLSIVSIVMTLVLGVVAIWLSIQFYVWSSKAEKEAVKASTDISSAVDRLEKLFDKLHSETFTMMKDMVTDMRTSIFPPGGKQVKPRRRSTPAEEASEDTPPPTDAKPAAPSSGIAAQPLPEAPEEGRRNG